MLLNVQLNVVPVELSQSLQLDAKGPNGVLFRLIGQKVCVKTLITLDIY